jgi:hypothetical protein
LGTFRYGVHLGLTPGLRYGGTLEPTLNITDSLTVAVGLGVGGFVINNTGATSPRPEIVASLTYPGTEPLLGACTGTGLLAVARAEYLFVASTLFATGPSLQVDAQWTACNQSLGRTDPDSGEAIELRQYWRNYGVSLAWLFWWR